MTSLAHRIFQRVQSLDLAARLPALTGLAGERIEAIQGGAAFSSTEYERLCRALAVDPHALYAGEEALANRSLVRFRTALDADLSRPADLRTLALAAEAGRILGHLWRGLGRPATLDALRAFKAVNQGGETWREGYALGEAARARLAWPAGPVHDLEGRLGQLGVHVARVDLGSPHIDAACVWEPEALPIILLNTSAPAARHPGACRSAVAHELAHLLHDGGADRLVTRVSRNDPQGSYAEAVEVRARAFAPAFLAPREQVQAWSQGLRRVRSDRERVRRLAEAWGFSFEGAAWHAKNCGVVGATEAEALARLSAKPLVDLAPFSQSPASTPPSMIHPGLPEDAAPLWAGVATEIILAALEEGHLSLGRARELLTWS